MHVSTDGVYTGDHHMMHGPFNTSFNTILNLCRDEQHIVNAGIPDSVVPLNLHGSRLAAAGRRLT